MIIKKGSANEIYNIGNGIPIYLKDIILYAKNEINSTSDIKGIDAVEFHKKVQTKNMVLDITKIKNIGYQQKYSIYDIIKILS